jgi:hypothetical protein
MTYTLYTNGVLEKDGFYLPLNETNPDYMEYLAWVAQGNTPESADGSIYLAKVADNLASTEQIRATYQTMITRLEQIESVANPTNAQVVAAVRDLATYQKRIMKYLKTVL